MFKVFTGHHYILKVMFIECLTDGDGNYSPDECVANDQHLTADGGWSHGALLTGTLQCLQVTTICQQGVLRV